MMFRYRYDNHNDDYFHATSTDTTEEHAL